MLAAILLIASAATLQAEEDPVLVRMVALYEEACLKAFPDDSALASVMAAKGATALNREDVKIYLHDDPGRGWSLTDGSENFIITLEDAPYHACAVRRMTVSGFSNYAVYIAAVARYEKPRGGFSKIEPANMKIGSIASHATGEQKIMPDGSAESLFVFENSPTDQKGRDKGPAYVDVRFVHQFMSARAR